jgi:hypothetical protein
MIRMALVFGFVFSLSACDSIREASGPGTQTAETTAETADTEVTSPATDTISEQITDNTEAVQEETISAEPENDPASTTVKVQKTMLQMKIGETKVSVNWEDNDSVAALKELCKDAPLTIQMSMYGGFEQVGPIGTRLPSNDAQTTTSAGDIVLYSSNQIVVFYGSNSWAYTRLGHITDQDAAGMASLLGNGNVTITISMEDAE